MNRDIRRLLSFIVTHYAAASDRLRIELDANAELSGDEIETDKEVAERRERVTADREAHAFERGLTLAWERAQKGDADIELDDRDPGQNAIASALIDFLVRFELAESRSRDVGDQHYIYMIRVNWDRLREVARENDQTLEDLFDSHNGVA